MMNVAFCKAALLASAAVFPLMLSAAEPQPSERPEWTGEAVNWALEHAHGGATLRVVRPDGELIVRSAPAGTEAIQLGFDEEAWPQGVYLWELTLAPALTDAQLAELKGAREAGRARPVDVGTGAPRRQGSFRLAEGQLHGLGATVTEDARAERSDGDSYAPAATPISGDQTIYNSLCVGFSCVDNETYGSDTIRLREDNLRIAFLDSSSAAGFAAGDWQLRANEATNGGASLFAVDWLGTGSGGNAGDGPVSTPLRINGGAPTNALYVATSGNVGLGTPSPTVELHLRDGDTPTLRLEQDVSSGFGAQTWDVAGNETSFFVRDATNGSTLPFRIRPGAASNALVIDGSSSVGIGTLNPAARLHVVGDARIDGAVYQLSSRSAKTGFESPEPARLLERIEGLDLGFWRYKDQESRHFGPSAEDFHAAFGLGDDQRRISVADMAGIALGATQALREEIRQRDATIAELTRRLERLEAALDDEPAR